jgi:glucose/arabinose dehydrogenase
MRHGYLPERCWYPLVAALGMSFSSPTMGPRFAGGAFPRERGSWNSSAPSDCKVVFVPFGDGRPSGPLIDLVTGFRGAVGTTGGRPVGVTVDPRGALIVADDLSNTLWRVTPVGGRQSAGAPRPSLETVLKR